MPEMKTAVSQERLAKTASLASRRLHPQRASATSWLWVSGPRPLGEIGRRTALKMLGFGVPVRVRQGAPFLEKFTYNNSDRSPLRDPI